MRGNQYFDPWVFLPKDALHAWARDELLSSARDFAASVGIPELARLENLKPPDPSPTLRSIVKLYVEKSAASRHERQKAERYIREFRRFAKGQTLADITQAQVADYFDWVMSSANSVTWKRHRLGKIKTVLNFAIKRGVSPEEVERVLRLCRILVMPKRTSGDPSPIDPDQFAALLDSADEKWRAILLVALNCCMYAREVESLDRSDVDLDKGVVVTSRSKTGVTRVAVLWRRTIAALRKLPVEKNEALFVGAAGTRYRADHLRRGFDRLRKKANVPNQVKFSDLRDGAYTAAVEGGADLTHAKLLAGHATGITDYYVRRNPNMVVSACAAIEAHYFCQEPC